MCLSDKTLDYKFFSVPALCTYLRSHKYKPQPSTMHYKEKIAWRLLLLWSFSLVAFVQRPVVVLVVAVKVRTFSHFFIPFWKMNKEWPLFEIKRDFISRLMRCYRWNAFLAMVLFIRGGLKSSLDLKPKIHQT